MRKRLFLSRVKFKPSANKRENTSPNMYIFFTLFFLLRLSTAQDDCLPTNCSDHGPIIHFPFRLMNHHPPHCGYPGFDLSCSPNTTATTITTTLLNLPNSVEVLVTAIDYVSQLIHIKDPNSCFPQLLQNLNLSTTPFQFAGSTGPFSLFSCPSRNPDFPNWVTCLSGEYGDGRGVYAAYSYWIINNPPIISCKKMYSLSSVPIEAFDQTADLQLYWPYPNSACQYCRLVSGCRILSNSTTGAIECTLNQKDNWWSTLWSDIHWVFSSQFYDPYENPYYLHHSDSPTTVLVSPPLNGDNYNTWFRAMRMALRAKNKMGFVDGTITKPDQSSPTYSQWERVNDMICSWILHSIMLELSGSIIYSESALDIWNDLKGRFSQPNGTKIYQLKRSLYECKQDNLSVTAYFTHLKSIWDELASYDPPPLCTCGASKSISCLRERDQVMQFLYGLDVSYGSLRSQLLLYEPLPSVNKVYSFILQEEKQRELSHTTFIKPEASALAAHSNNGSRNHTGSRAYVQQPSRFIPKARPRPHCDHCNNDGHTISTCYKIHGYPPRKQGNNKSFNGSSPPCGMIATTNQ